VKTRKVLGIFLFTTASKTGSGAYPASYPMGTGALSLGVKRPGREADHSPPSSSEVKNAWNYDSNPQYVFKAWCLVKHRDKCVLPYLYLRGIGWEGVDWMHLAQKRDQWRGLLNTVMNLRVP